MRYSVTKIKKLVSSQFNKVGFKEDEVDIIADVLLRSDLFGIESHGVQRMSYYMDAIESGEVSLEAIPEIEVDTPISQVIDANRVMGQLVSHRAMQTAIDKAKQSGIGIVSVRDSNHYGIAGYYAEMAIKEGLIGISSTNTAAIMVPTHSLALFLGTNPIAIGMPADPTPFLFDASTTVVTHGKIELYEKADKPLPEGWGVTPEGMNQTSAKHLIEGVAEGKNGGILPLGGFSELFGSHKGYGFGMAVEIFSALLSGGKTSDEVSGGIGAGVCHNFIALNLDYFGDSKEITKRMSDYLVNISNLPNQKGEKVYFHGEKEAIAECYTKEHGILVSEKTRDELINISKKLSLDKKDWQFLVE